ncbi:MAG: hypothetical protein HQK49_21760 [Oligoflexia bacterium]|nr:hypothetical protein [Oligoflexia bacterium]
MNKKKYSTSTLINKDQIVPWLAAKGSLAYSPESPPDSDYFFKYNWILPDIFNSKVNKRKHQYFGYPFKDHYEVKELLTFWNSCRKGVIEKVYAYDGEITDNKTTSPIAVYKHNNKFIIIQHGSYQFVKNENQRELNDGIVYIYRGIGDEPSYKHYRINNSEIYNNIMKIHANTLSDSVISFNTVHSNIKRSESSALNHGTFILYDHARDLKSCNEKEIISILNSGYSLDYNYGYRKFGPNYVWFKTNLNNIRITTFFCGEDEVKIIDPNKLEIANKFGCKINEIII